MFVFSRERMSDNISITDLRILFDFLRARSLDLEVGERTPADGSCFLHSIRQGISELVLKGQWSQDVPEVEDLRKQVINYMRENRAYWTRPRFNEELGVFQDAPYEDQDFDELIADQSRERAWTDLNGTFVQATTMFLRIQLDIILPRDTGPLLPSGLAGPYQIINRNQVGEEMPILYVGLLQDSRGYNGHYQYLRKIPAQPLASPPRGLCRASSQRTLSSTPSPLKVKRSRIISKYLRSPRKVKLFKEQHCWFCLSSVRGIELEKHLEESGQCLKKYLTNYKIKSIVPVLLKEFSCLFCQVKGPIRITAHLKKNDSCLQLYLKRFAVPNLPELQDKLEKFRRMLRPSASATNRKRETEKAREKKMEKEEKKTEIDLINDHRSQTSFSNVLLCYKCGTNYLPSSKRVNEVQIFEEEFLNDPNIKRKRRFEKYHQCAAECPKGEVSQSVVTMIMKEERNILFFPAPQTDDGYVPPPLSDAFEEVKNLTCLLPANLSSLGCFDQKKIKSRQQSVGLLYQVQPDLQLLYSVIAENELSKYKSLKMFGDRFEAEVLDSTSRVLKNAEKTVNDSSIVASETWRSLNLRHMIHRVDQLGRVCLQITVKLPLNTNDVSASVLIQEGYVVTVDFVGDSSNERENQYFIHNHRSETDCSPACIKIPLTQYLQDISFDTENVTARNLSAYIASAQLKFNSLVRNFVKASSSPLHSEEFHFQLSFNIDNSVDIKGLIWPKAFHDLNTLIGEDRTFFDEKIKQEIVADVDSKIMATGNKDYLKQKLGLSEIQADNLRDKIMKHQFHVCEEDSSCEKCLETCPPTLDTMVLEWSPNFYNCRQFIVWMWNELDRLARNDIQNLSTQDWLKQVLSSGRISASRDNEEFWKVSIDERNLFFKIDERMTGLLKVFNERFSSIGNLLALYHYSASTTSEADVGSVIIQRPFLEDIYISEFSVTVMKALDSRSEIKIVNMNKDQCRKFVYPSMMLHSSAAVDLDVKISSTHQEVSLTEAATLFDKKFLRSSSSNPIEFCCAVEKRKKLFKKVKHSSENTFRDEKSDTNFEELLTNIERFFMRMSLKPKICLSEFCLYYDYTGAEQSKELYKLFTRKDVQIQDSIIHSVTSQDFLPEIIILSNRDVMKIRTSPKILVYPQCDEGSDAWIYQKVLLFSPRAKESMSKEDVIQLYSVKDINDEGELTQIQKIEKALFPMKKSSRIC